MISYINYLLIENSVLILLSLICILFFRNKEIHITEKYINWQLFWGIGLGLATIYMIAITPTCLYQYVDLRFVSILLSGMFGGSISLTVTMLIVFLQKII